MFSERMLAVYVYKNGDKARIYKGNFFVAELNANNLVSALGSVGLLKLKQGRCWENKECVVVELLK